ncbi:helix-turn-helix transcriptional regulator [Deinococcus sp.]|uniref:helix-turn-helix transcriptional regulator n=1 Tax=Deinococcus sp. TaxID=47478 RepID=UPI0025FBAB66|nr:helix-turn-helix transcriptional regulator [Deinococcus sp.]
MLSDLLTDLRVHVAVRSPATAAGVRAFLSGAGLSLVGDPAEADVSVIDDAWLADPDAISELSGVVALGSPIWASTLAELAPAGWAALGEGAGPLDVLAGVLAAAVGLAALDAAQVGLLGRPGELGELGPSDSGDELGSGTPGAPSLTPREHEVLELLAAGLSNKRAARQLGVSEHTVKFHAQALYAKLGVGSRAAAVTRGVQLGVLSV